MGAEYPVHGLNRPGLLEFLTLFISMSIFIWNCQGAANPKFIATLRSFLQNLKPLMVVLVEPRISGVRADKAIKKIGLPHSHRVEANGFSGGIWLLWENCVDLTIIQSHHQFIHAGISWPLVGLNTQFTAIYGSPTPSLRERLWTDLKGIRTNSSGSWFLAGDFNAVLFSDERKGGRSSLRSGNKSFVNFVAEHSLIDLGFSGPKYTWRRGTDRKSTRLNSSHSGESRMPSSA